MFHIQYRIENWVGVTPFLTERRSKAYNFFIYLMYLLNALICCWNCVIITKSISKGSGFTETQQVLHIIYYISDLFAVAYYLMNTIFNKGTWKVFIKKLRQFEHQRITAQYTRRNDKITSTMLVLNISILVTMFTVMVLGVFGSYYYMRRIDSRIIISVIVKLIRHLVNHMIVAMGIVIHILIYKYEELDLFLTCELNSSNATVDNVFKTANFLHGEYFMVVQYLNRIFGCPILFYLVSSFAVTLYDIIHSIFEYVHAVDNVIASIILNYVFMCNVILDLTVMVVLITSCDALEKAGKKVNRTCNVLQRGLAKSRLRDHLAILAAYTKDQRPSISVAGLITVNQLIVNLLVSTFITYLIVALQFDEYL
ncbi:uncharacterized protein [Leptinotarsa decemlineata]|uniref:uncharacterized protein n=1 Tax=Leptinotarsa decemlineata TaxID=7539 RepID=UPI003D3078CF